MTKFSALTSEMILFKEFINAYSIPRTLIKNSISNNTYTPDYNDFLTGKPI